RHSCNSQSGRAQPHSKTWRKSDELNDAARFWSAAVLCRFRKRAPNRIHLRHVGNLRENGKLSDICIQRAAITAQPSIASRPWNLKFGFFSGFGIWHLFFLFCLTASFESISANLTPAQIQFFENKIRPIFVNNCYKCHSQQA